MVARTCSGSNGRSFAVGASSLAGIFLAMTLATSPRMVSAQSGSNVMARIRFVEQRLQAGSGRASLWWYGWLIGQLGMAAGAAAAGTMADHIRQGREAHDFRTQMVVNAVASVVSCAPLVVSPWPAMHGDAPLSALPEASAGEQQTKLTVAEQLLRGSAEREQFGRSWPTHLGGLVVNAAAGAVLWFGYHLRTQGLTAVAVGTVISQLRIWTQPMRAVDDLRAYEEGRLGDADQSRASSRPVRFWSVVPTPGGAAVNVEF